MVMMGKLPNIGVDLPSFVAVVIVSINVLCSPWPIVRSTNAQTDLDFVVVLRSPVATSSAPTVLSVYQGARDFNLRTVSFDKAVLVGSPNDPFTQRYQFRNNNPRVPNGAIRGSDPATLTLPATMTTGARTGVYTVTVSEGAGQELGVKVLVTNEDAVIRAESYSTVVSRGDHFLLYVLRDETIPLSNLRWLMDGIPEGQPFTVCQGGQRCGENSAMNTTVYECYSEVSTYATQHHAIMNLIVRDCPHNMWGPPDCTGLCEPCINGGICSDSTGLCLCPPGFSGDGCQMVHGRNVFGQNAEYKCDDSGDDRADGCQGAIICYPDPLGCFCPAGYKGLNCSQECETGKFGANCKQECHCADNTLCALDTGVCENNQCEDGWRGTNCQLVDGPCPVGVYGDFCNLPCSCSGGEDACSEVEANCVNGCAVPWTGIACDQDSGPGSIVSFDQIRGNPGQLYIVSCSAVRNPVIDSSSLKLNILAPRLESRVEERAYLTTNTWHLPYTTTPIGCAFQTTGHFEYQQFSLLPPFILPVYANPSNVLNFSDVTSTSITVSWPAWNNERDIGDGPIIDYRIQHQEEGTTETFMEVKKGGGLSHQFTGLQPDTQYEFRIVLVREGQGGEGSPSNTQRQRTLCQAPGLPTLAVVPSSRSASFDIMILSEDRRCSSAMVELQTWTGVTWIKLRQLSSTTSAETIFSLIPCTHHRYRLQVANNAGTQTSEIIDFITQTEALASVSGFQVISVLPGQLEVIWEPNDLSLNNCSVVSYSVIYQFLSYLACPTAALTDVEIGEVTTNRNTISISKLRSYARYLVTVRANGDINGPENSREALTEESVAAAPPENVVVERDSSTDLEFRWDPPPCESQNGVITNYSYQLLQCNKTITEGTTESQGVVLVDLIPFTEYSFMVAASTSEGSGPASDAIVVTTEEDVPPQLPPPSTSFTTLTTILLSWVRPDPPHGIITGYDISFKVADEISSLQTVGLDVAEIIPENQPSYTLNNLKPVTIYSVMVRATTRLGPGMWSLPTLIITVDSLPGPPRNLNVTEMTETTLIIEWDGPSQPTWEIIKYQLRFRVVERFYQSQFVPEEFGPVVEISNPRAHNVHLISGLEPSTVYEIELSAFTEAGQGEVTMLRGRTDLVTDLEPVSISTVSRNVETATMILPPLTQAYSTGYYIRVKSTLVQEKMKRNIGGVGNYDDNPDEYIAAEIVKSEEEQSFTVGDGKEYGIYYNAPLRQDQEYQVFIGTGSKVGQDISVVWSEPILLEENTMHVVIPIPVLVVLAVVILVVFVIIFIILRRWQIKKSSSPENTATETNPSLVCSSSFSWPDIGTTDISLKETRLNSEKGKPDDDLGHVIGKQLTVEEREHYLLSSVVNQTPLESSSLAKETGTAACEDMRGGEPRLARTQSIYLENNCHPDGIDQLENSDADDFVKSKTLKHSELQAIPTTHSDCDQALDPCYEELPSPPESVHCLIKLKDLPKQLQGKNSDPEDTITDEFKKLPTGQQHPWTVGTLRKNSNTGILPYDHSRVKLDKNDLDYYNANYLKVHPSQTFIAAQGPSERTAEVFWRMVWSEKVKIIINLRQTLKSAFQYWPSGVESNKTFGEYTLIWFKNSHESMDISVKDIKIVKGDKVHEVKICHFLSWPDGSIPPQSVSLIDFIKDIKALKIKSAPLVHCSNGVGATGTFIALYCLMDDLKDSKKTGLSVSSFVNRMRKDRVNMIENELQYWFLYECLVVALLSHEKKTLADGIMMNLTQEDEITQEYKVLQTFRCYSVQRSFHIGQQPENVGKNRYSTVLPADFARAVLQTPGSLQGYTDYINASVVDSCFSKDAFIMTQSPLPTTAEDFWRMVHDYDCAAVVCLNQMDENDETICSYWPDSGSKEYGNMVVECKDTAVKDKHCSQCKLSVKCLKNKRVVTVDHYQLIEWSQDSDQTDGIIELIGKIKPITEEKRTIVVHCMDGASRCGVFVSALLEISCIRESKTRRLLETVHKLSGQNPHVMKSLDDYHLCHHLVKAVLVEDESKYQEVI